jgi:hypothetical protein
VSLEQRGRTQSAGSQASPAGSEAGRDTVPMKLLGWLWAFPSHVLTQCQALTMGKPEDVRGVRVLGTKQRREAKGDRGYRPWVQMTS